ncbi:MAG: polymer-forming cytoskeletal protein [Caldilineae bacterium]|nr:MAG: polymer-forming cytoskeletal protein [Caldilineae bacterium]
MFKLFGAKKPPLDKIETVIGSHTSFEGHLKCDGNIRIDGVVEGGVIETAGNVVISPEGRVAARIIAEHVLVAGEATGGIEARGYLEILSTGRVQGDVRVANFYKDEGGILEGNLHMHSEAEEAAGEQEAAPAETESPAPAESSPEEAG